MADGYTGCVNSQRIPLIVVAGPTASGKSSLALHLARSCGGEIVNCDSLQLYRGMDIGTAKPSPGERAEVPHHLFDLLEPTEVFNAGDYAARARDCIRDIRLRGRLPVLVGGTGFYLRALLEGLAPGPQRDDRLRQELSGRESRRPGFLRRLLRRKDPAAASRIHGNDRNKLLRAVEICLLSRGSTAEMFQLGRDAFHEALALKLVLSPPRHELAERIEARTRRMFAEGLVEELAGLLDRGIPSGAKAFEAIGYRQAGEVLAGRLSPAEAEELVTIATRQYAKRQLTWFRRESDVQWLAGFGDEPVLQGTALELVCKFLRQFSD